MGCIIGCLALAAPRVALALVYLFSNYLGRAYQTHLWPVLGFLFMPLTTLAYAWAMNTNHGTVNGVYLAVVVLAALMDLGLVGASAKSRRRER